MSTSSYQRQPLLSRNMSQQRSCVFPFFRKNHGFSITFGLKSKGAPTQAFSLPPIGITMFSQNIFVFPVFFMNYREQKFHFHKFSFRASLAFFCVRSGVLQQIMHSHENVVHNLYGHIFSVFFRKHHQFSS